MDVAHVESVVRKQNRDACSVYFWGCGRFVPPRLMCDGSLKYEERSGHPW